MIRGIEFLFSPSGDETNYQKDGRYQEFTEKDVELIKYLDQEFEARYPKAHACATERYNSRPNFKYLRVHRLIKCNWGNSDENLDIDLAGNWNFEKVYCPLRGGFCSDEGLICMPEEQTNLSNREKEVVILAMYSDKEIAEQLCISPHTVENHMCSALRKLDLHSRGQLVDYAHKHKLIK